MKTYIIIFFMFSLTLSACDSFFNQEVLVDNHDFSTMKITVDGKTKEIAGYTSSTYSLARGEHEFKVVVEGKTILDTVLVIKNDGLLNVLGSTYVVWRDLYIKESDNEEIQITDYEKYAEKALNNKDEMIGDKLYQDVDFDIHKGDLFIEKNWDFGPNEDWASIDLKENYAVKAKIYRLLDLEKSWGFYGDFDFTDKTDAELQHFLDSLANSLAQEDTVAL